MDSISGLMYGFSQVFIVYNFSFLVLGVALGLIIGVLPGVGGTAGVAILLPVTVFIAPAAALMMLAGIYWGSMFGGIVTSVLFGVPGNPWSVAVMFDGRPLAKAGKAGLAMTAAFVVSIISAMLASLLFTFLAAPFAGLALRFGPPELFAVLLITYGTFVGLGGGSPFKTLIMLCTGFVLSAIGLDLVTGAPRLTFGTMALLNGVDFIPVAIGLFGIGEILYTAAERIKPGALDLLQKSSAGRMHLSDLVETLRAVKQRIVLILSCSLMGFWTGILPGLGATPASFMAYGVARRTAKNPDEFGKGAIEGVMAPESANNAAGIGSILPMLTLGIPGSPTAAVIMAGLFTWGLMPGPTLFEQNPQVVWGFISSLYVANVIAFVACLVATPLLASVLRVPYAILTPIIVICSILGAYAVSNSMFDVMIVLISGFFGYILRKLQYPLAPLIVAMVLGGPTEKALRQTMIMSGGTPVILFTRPLASFLTVTAILLFLLPLLTELVRRLLRARRAEERASVAADRKTG